MAQCQYNEILNKIYSIIRNDEKILRLIHYVTDVDIDDEVICPPLTKAQKVAASKNIKKYHNVNVVNGMNKVYITMEFKIVDFGDPSKRGKHMKYFSNIIFDVYVSCPDNIEELQGGSRCMEIISRLQDILSDANVDAQKNTRVCYFQRERAVDDFISYRLSLKFMDINDGMVGREIR